MAGRQRRRRVLAGEIVNAPDVIGANSGMITINGALAIDIHGQVVADTISGDQFSGIGGAEDFVVAPGSSCRTAR